MTVDRLDLPDTAPVVTGEIAAPPGAPTVLLYSHYDVVPAGDVVGALRAWGGRPPVGIKLCIEGYEEIGSGALTAYPPTDPERFQGPCSGRSDERESVDSDPSSARFPQPGRWESQASRVLQGRDGGGVQMTSQDRLARLRKLARELERSSPSAERDALLREIRERVVLLEIGAYESRAWQRQEWSNAAFAASASIITLDG